MLLNNKKILDFLLHLLIIVPDSQCVFFSKYTIKNKNVYAKTLYLAFKYFL